MAGPQLPRRGGWGRGTTLPGAPSVPGLTVGQVRAIVRQLLVEATGGGGGGLPPDADYGDVTVSASGLTWTIDDKDGAAGTPSMRTLGTTGVQACAGNDARLSDARTPLAHTHTGSDITTLIVENRTSDPASPETGRLWLRTDL